MTQMWPPTLLDKQLLLISQTLNYGLLEQAYQQQLDQVQPASISVLSENVQEINSSSNAIQEQAALLHQQLQLTLQPLLPILMPWKKWLIQILEVVIPGMDILTCLYHHNQTSRMDGGINQVQIGLRLTSQLFNTVVSVTNAQPTSAAYNGQTPIIEDVNQVILPHQLVKITSC